MGSKRVRVKDVKEDRFSDLPDVIIQHILSFLPSTKEVVRTEILSKRWKNQWTQVPVLIFRTMNSGMSSDVNFLNFIDNTLIRYKCSKIKKFHLIYPYTNEKIPDISSKIRFATSKDVEDLYLCFCDLLPEFLFNNASLVKLGTTYCTIMPNRKVNWEFLTTLSITQCKLADQAVEHILSGSPLLQSLEIAFSSEFRKIVIASKCLKRFLLRGGHYNAIDALEISCPKLEELSLGNIFLKYDQTVFARAIENILSVSLLIESVELFNCGRVVGQLVIASNSLKRLFVEHIKGYFDIEILCPNLEEFKMFGKLNVGTAKLLDLSSSLRAIIDFQNMWDLQINKSLIIEILEQLHHVNNLKFGGWFIEIMSTIKVGRGFSPLLNVKCLTLDSPNLKKQHSGIASLLRISPELEKLVINASSFYRKSHYKVGKNYWISNKIVFDCLVSHLKIIEIVHFGFTERNVKCQHLLNLVQFLLKNAKVLEKMVVVVKDYGKGSSLQVSQEFLSFPRCAQNAVIEVLNSN